MILTVTPNPSVDRTVFLEALIRGSVNRSVRSWSEPSGKGVNVALGCPAFSGLLNLRSLCGELRIQVFGADFAWCPVAECGVNSSLIVEQFDVAGNVLLRFLP